VGSQADDQERWKREAQRQLSAWTPRRFATWALFLLAAIVAVQHLVAHAGYRPLPISMGWQDILVGYPMAMALGIFGAIVWGAKPEGH
jgi:hypothetical protein